MNNIDELNFKINNLLLHKIIYSYNKLIDSNLYSKEYNYKLFIKYCEYLKEITKNDKYYKLISKISKLKKIYFNSIEMKKIMIILKTKYLNEYKIIKKLKDNINKNKNIISIINVIKSINDSKIKKLYKLLEKYNFISLIKKKQEMDVKKGVTSKLLGQKFEEKVYEKIAEIIKINFGIKSNIKILNNIKIINTIDMKTIGEIDHIVTHNDKTIALFEDKYNLDDIGYAYKQLNKICNLINSKMKNIILKDENDNKIDNNILLSLKKTNSFYERYFIVTAYFEDKHYFNLKSSYKIKLLSLLWKNNKINKLYYKKIFNYIKKNINDEESTLSIINKYKNKRKLNLLIVLSL